MRLGHRNHVEWIVFHSHCPIFSNYYYFRYTKGEIGMSVFTFAPMRASLPRVSMPAVRPQQKLVASLPSFTGMRMSKLMPVNLEGKEINVLEDNRVIGRR